MIGWGMIGVGDVTEVKSAPAIFRAVDSDVVHVMRRDAERARDFAERHGVARWSADAQAVIDDPEVTAVYVATPTATHAQYAIAAARAGKHVLVEKPMAMSAGEAGRMVEPVVWVPIAIGTMKSATAAAEPLEEPPGVRVRSCGLRVGPGWRLANSVVTVLPSRRPPAFRDKAMHDASRSGWRPRWIGVPHSVGMSALSMISLTPNGTPASGPDAPLRSSSRAAAMA